MNLKKWKLRKSGKPWPSLYIGTVLINVLTGYQMVKLHYKPWNLELYEYMSYKLITMSSI